MRHKVGDYSRVPKSRLLCPFCQDELNMKFDGFTQYSAVDGPYLKGGIVLECSAHKCPYRHAVLYKSQEGKTILKMESVLAKLVKSLPRFGPWEKLEVNEKPKRRRRP